MNRDGKRKTCEDMKKWAPGWLVNIGDETLPSYIEIIINHYKDLY